MINKVVRDTVANPCTDGSATCVPNSICIPDPSNDSYTVSVDFSMMKLPVSYNHQSMPPIVRMPKWIYIRRV